jgi:hypothetical protein
MSFNTDYKVNNVDLAAQIFPPYEIGPTFNINNAAAHTTSTITLTNNKAGNTNYHVFTSLDYYQHGGSGSTYPLFEASGSANRVLIFNKTAGSFDFGFSKGTGDFWNGGISFLIIYHI